MDEFLRDLNCADPFVDNIIVESKTPEMKDDELIEGHFVALWQVLDVLSKDQLTYNEAKAVLSPGRWSSRDRTFTVPFRGSWHPSPTSNEPRT